MKINLNLQSDYSLKTKGTVQEVLDEFRDFDIVSIADHNSVKSCYDLKNTSVKCITGLEADAVVGEYTFDYLCYGFNVPEVDAWVSKKFMTIPERQKLIFDRLVKICQEKGIVLDMSAAYVPEKEYAHDAIFRMLPNDFKKQNKLANTDDFYRKGTMDKSFPLYLNMNFLWPDLKELIEVIHNNGGLIFLAHPKRYKFDYKLALELNKDLVDGIEISNQPESQQEVDELYAYAISHGLKVTYGTNYNGLSHTEKEPTYVTSEHEKALLSWAQNYL